MVSVLLFTVKHSAVVLMEVSPVKTGHAWLDWVYSAGAVLTLDAAVFIFAIHRMKWQAIIFALVIFAVNLIYFRTDIPYRNWIAASLLSATFAYAVYSFTELFVKDFARLQPKAKAQPKVQGESETPETERRKRKPKDPRASLRAKRSQLRKRLAKDPGDLALQEKLTEIENILSQ